LPKPETVARQIGLTAEQRERNQLWTLPPVDLSKEQIAERKRQRDRERKRRARRRAGQQARGEYLAQFDKPWIAAGVSRATWFRRKAKDAK
jgi:hypothetical protein